MLMLSANPVWAKHLAFNPAVKPLIAKFSVVMIGLFMFSIITYIGLSIYNKFFVDEKLKDFNLRQNSLDTPKDKDEAILLFISKNRLK